MADPTLTYPEAIFIGLLQGVTELFPVSSLGHSVLIPAIIGGRWAKDLSMTAQDSPYLAFVVAVHVATAIALVIFFRSDWIRIVKGLFSSIRERGINTPDQRLAWMLIVATIPVGLAGVLLEHAIRAALGKPVPAAIFLILNGVLLATVERLRQRKALPAEPTPVQEAANPYGGGQYGQGQYGGGQYGQAQYGEPQPVGQVYASSAAKGGGGVSASHGGDTESDNRLSNQSWGQAVLIGAAQILALFPGISRSGATIGAGLLRGLSHEDAARFAFLLATPVILAAGVLKLPELAGPQGKGILGPVLVGSVVAGLAAFVSLRFLTKYFETRTLNPFAIYCVIAGIVALIWTSVF